MIFALVPNPIESLIEESKKYIGEQEVPKLSNRSTRIDYWLKETGVDFGLPWCAAFVSQVGRQTIGRAWPVPRSASVQAIVDWAKPLSGMGVWQDTPEAGDLFVLYFDSLKRYAHIGIVTKVNGNKFTAVEGNTNTDGSRDGYGVFERTRTVDSKTKFIRWIKMTLTNENTLMR